MYRLELDRIVNVRKDLTLITAILPIGDFAYLGTFRHDNGEVYTIKVYICTCICVYDVCTCICVYDVCTCICVYDVCTCVYVLNLYLYIHVFVYIYIFTYI
jgi:hypothetical protein